MIGTRAPWLSEYSEGTRSLSISALDNWVACPLKWFFRYVLDVKAEQDVDEEPTAAEVGTLVHAILETYEVEKDAARRQGGLAEWDARARLYSAAHRHLDGLRLDELRKDRLKVLLGLDGAATGSDATTSTGGLLDSYLERESSRTVAPMRTWCEVAFGRVPRDGQVFEKIR
jgi:hypothetical protein